LSTSSTTENASKSGVFLSMIESILSFGMVISVSTFSFNDSNQSSDLLILFCPSKANGFVTIHILKAHSSFATSATTGAAHVPVHPPRPQVIKTISAQVRASFISSLDSSAAFLPTSGSLPAHRPEVIIFQIFNFFGANELNKAWASVFTAMNSTPSNHDSIILFTAFCHAHHTHTTFIFATGDMEAQIFTSVGHVAVVVLPQSKSFNLSSLFVIILC
jgi:hypothetical protein